MAELGRLGIENKTLVILTADHGEFLGEHGQRGHGFSLAEPVTRVPLMLRGPGIATQRIETPVSSLDIVPTVLDLVGQRSPATFHGHSLVPLLRKERRSRPPPILSEIWKRAPDGTLLFRKLALYRGGFKLNWDPLQGGLWFEKLGTDQGRADVARMEQELRLWRDCLESTRAEACR